MMNRNDFQTLTNLRLNEARVLLDNRCWAGAYYLAGYAVECALKACIARNVNRYDFPDKNTVMESYTHDLAKLMKAANLQVLFDAEIQANPTRKQNWYAVKDWSEQERYNALISQSKAEELFDAITDKRNGVLVWIKKFW